MDKSSAVSWGILAVLLAVAFGAWDFSRNLSNEFVTKELFEAKFDDLSHSIERLVEVSRSGPQIERRLASLEARMELMNSER